MAIGNYLMQKNEIEADILLLLDAKDKEKLKIEVEKISKLEGSIFIELNFIIDRFLHEKRSRDKISVDEAIEYYDIYIDSIPEEIMDTTEKKVKKYVNLFYSKYQLKETIKEAKDIIEILKTEADDPKYEETILHMELAVAIKEVNIDKIKEVKSKLK